MKFRIYAGLGGSFGGAQYHGTYEFSSQEEADRAAYDLAWEEYESYGGMHGLLDWDGVYEDCLESGYIELEAMSQTEIENIVDDYYLEQVEGWLCYQAVLVSGAEPFDGDGDEDYNPYADDDSDCFCDD